MAAAADSLPLKAAVAAAAAAAAAVRFLSEGENGSSEVSLLSPSRDGSARRGQLSSSLILFTKKFTYYTNIISDKLL